jgi:hypothetical protein
MRFEVFTAVHIHCIVFWVWNCVEIMKMTDVSVELPAFFRVNPGEGSGASSSKMLVIVNILT